MASREDLVLLSDAVHNDKAPPDGWEALEYKSLDKNNDINIEHYTNASGEVVVAIKGSTEFGDWKNVNPSFVTGSYTAEIRELVEHIAELEDKYGKEKLSITGFSQGAGLSQVMSEAFGIGGLAIDAPGGGKIAANPELAEHLASMGRTLQGMPDDFTTVIENNSLVGKIGVQLGNVEVVNLTEDQVATLTAMLSSVVMGPVPQAMYTLVAAIGLDFVREHNLLEKLVEQYAPEAEDGGFFSGLGNTISQAWDSFTDSVGDVVDSVVDFVSDAWDSVTSFFSDKQDDTTSAAAPESLDAELDGQEELEGEQNNAEQTEDDIEQAQQDDDLNDQRAAEPPPPSGDEGGNNPPSPRPGCGDSGPPSNNSGNSGGGCSIDDSSDDVNDGWSEPIVLDLNQNGEIELTALDQSNAFYDFDGDEYLNRVGWVSGDDGFLAIDIGGDGIIELGSEIAFADFGRYAVGQLELAEEVEAYLAEHGLLNENLDFNGDGVVNVADFDSDNNGLISDLEGLRYFDSNADGVIDSGDAVWGHLRVWQDYDQDGTSDAGEVSALDGLGDDSLNIASINLVSDGNKVEGGEYGEGNVVYGLGSYTTVAEGKGLLGDVAFSASNIGYKEDADGTVRMKYDDVETVYRDDSGGYFELS